jgi:hypothetical protein
VFGHADDDQFKIGMQALLAIVPSSPSSTAAPSPTPVIIADQIERLQRDLTSPTAAPSAVRPLTASPGGQFRAQLCAIAGSLGRPLFIRGCADMAHTVQLSAGSDPEGSDPELAHFNNQALHDQLLLELSAVFSFDNDSKCDVLLCCAEMDDQLSRCASALCHCPPPSATALRPLPLHSHPIRQSLLHKVSKIE